MALNEQKTSSADYSCTISVNVTPEKAMELINRVTDWWTPNIAGSTKNLNDEFKVSFGTTWKTFKITELVPAQKVVWLVTDCNLPWNSDPKEWKGNKISWHISAENNATQITFTHHGLAVMQCGNVCIDAWGGYIRKSLYSLIAIGKGQPG